MLMKLKIYYSICNMMAGKCQISIVGHTSKGMIHDSASMLTFALLDIKLASHSQFTVTYYLHTVSILDVIITIRKYLKEYRIDVTNTVLVCVKSA